MKTTVIRVLDSIMTTVYHTCIRVLDSIMTTVYPFLSKILLHDNQYPVAPLYYLLLVLFQATIGIDFLSKTMYLEDRTVSFQSFQLLQDCRVPLSK